MFVPPIHNHLLTHENLTTISKTKYIFFFFFIISKNFNFLSNKFCAKSSGTTRFFLLGYEIQLLISQLEITIFVDFASYIQKESYQSY